MAHLRISPLSSCSSPHSLPSHRSPTSDHECLPRCQTPETELTILFAPLHTQNPMGFSFLPQGTDLWTELPFPHVHCWALHLSPTVSGKGQDPIPSPLLFSPCLLLVSDDSQVLFPTLNFCLRKTDSQCCLCLSTEFSNQQLSSRELLSFDSCILSGLLFNHLVYRPILLLASRAEALPLPRKSRCFCISLDNQN